MKVEFVLDAKRSDPIYQLSLTGVNYSNRISGRQYNLKYVAFVDIQLKIKISIELFSMLHDKGFFSIWNPEAPYKYFEGFKEGYLVIFRVYEINKSIPEDLLAQGRKGRNYYFGLSQTHYCEAVLPVIDDDNFENEKLELIDLLKSKGWLLESIQSNFDIPVIVRIQEQKLREKETQDLIRNDKLSLVELEDKIKAKRINRNPIIVESKQYYRDPDVSSYAQKRANGICECCGNEAPFIKEDGMAYLETHHLIPLSQGGEDKIDNVCAVCPNCHRELHLGVNKIILKEKIIKSLFY